MALQLQRSFNRPRSLITLCCTVALQCRSRSRDSDSSTLDLQVSFPVLTLSFLDHALFVPRLRASYSSWPFCVRELAHLEREPDHSLHGTVNYNAGCIASRSPVHVHVHTYTRPLPRFQCCMHAEKCNIENVGVAWGRGYKR